MTNPTDKLLPIRKKLVMAMEFKEPAPVKRPVTALDICCSRVKDAIDMIDELMLDRCEMETR